MDWTKQDKERLEELQSKLTSAPVLSLPSLDRPFDLYMNAENGITHGVLAQDWGGVRKLVAFLSKLMDPVARGLPTCIQVVAATSILVEESQKLTFGGKLIVHTPHAVRSLLSQWGNQWLTDPRILRYKAVQMEHLVLLPDKSSNLAQFLYRPPQGDLAHNCLEVVKYQTKVREDLTDQLLSEGERCG